MGGVARLDKNGLPDAAGGGVPAPLFADGLLVIIHRVLNAEDDERGAPHPGPLPRAQREKSVRQIKFEGRIAAFVMA